MERADELHRQPVHVLRHQFMPSQNLIHELAPLFHTYSSEFTRTYGSKQIMLARHAFYHDTALNNEINSLQELFQSHTSPIFLTKQIELPTKDGQARLVFHPRHQGGFNEMLAELDTLPDLRRQRSDFVHFMYMQFPERALIKDIWRRKAIIDHVSRAVADPNAGWSHFMRVADMANSGYDWELPLPPPTAHRSPTTLKSAS